MSGIGTSVERVDAVGKVRGETLYPGDLYRPDMAHMKILFAGRPHARITRLDTAAAEALDGVLAVFTARDVPNNEYGLIMPDQPVLCGPGSTKEFADRVRFVGDQIAVVVAESEAIAGRALKLIEVDFEDLPVVLDPLQAMRPDSTLLHPDRGSNVFCHDRIRKGDLEAGFAAADVIVEGEYRTPAQEHAYLQPEAGLAYIDDQGRVTVEVAGQWTHEDQEQIAHALGLPLEQVRVIYPAIGGAFGGREDMSVQIVLALAAWRLHQRGVDRPVKIIWSREESIFGHHKRHPFILHARWGATTDGKLTAAEVEVIQDGGAYAYTSTKVLGNATLMCTGPYEFPNAQVDAYSVYTNHVPGGAFRGFGGPQGAFAAEGQMNKLAEALGIDPVELRLRNVLREGSPLTTGLLLPPGVSLAEVIEAAAEQAGWTRGEAGWQRPAVEEGSAAPGRVRGMGFALLRRTRTVHGRDRTARQGRDRACRAAPRRGGRRPGSAYGHGADGGRRTRSPGRDRGTRRLGHRKDREFRVGLGVTPDLHVRELDPRRGRSGAGEMDGRGTAGGRQLHLPRTADLRLRPADRRL